MPKVKHLKRGDLVLLSNGKIRVWKYTASRKDSVRAVKRNGKWRILDDQPGPISAFFGFLLPPK